MRSKLQSHQQRGRQVLLWTVGLYVFANLFIVGVIDGCWKELRSPFLIDIFHQMRGCSAGKPDVVCIGTSRFDLAFAADEVQGLMRYQTGVQDLEVFNASASAQDLITSDFIMAQMLQRGVRPKLAVIEVSPELVARHNHWLGNHIMPTPTFSHLSTYLGDLRRASANLSGLISDRVYPVFRCRREIWSTLGDSLEERGAPVWLHANRGWGPRRVTVSRTITPETFPSESLCEYRMILDDKKIQARKARVEGGLDTVRKWLQNYEVGGLTCEALERLLQRCRDHQVRVVLVMPPMSSEQRELYTPEIEAVYQECIRDYQRRYACSYVDCRDQVPDCCFSDHHHVCIPEGSKPFSRQLTREVLVPAWNSLRAMPTVARMK